MDTLKLRFASFILDENGIKQAAIVGIPWL